MKLSLLSIILILDFSLGLSQTDSNPCKSNNEIDFKILTNFEGRVFCSNNTEAKLYVENPSQFTTIEWDTGDSGKEIRVSKSAGYTVTATDDNGCTYVDNVWISEQPLPDVTYSNTESFICNGQSITLAISSNDESTTIEWSNGIEGSDSIVVSKGGKYIANLTHSFDRCFEKIEFNISELNGDCCTIGPPIVIDVDSETETCPNTLALVNLIVSGGTAPYSLLSSGPIKKVNNQKNGHFEIHMSAYSNWELLVTDINGCTSTKSISVFENNDNLDSDADGICDSLDEFPNEPCLPYIDKDEDGVCKALDCDDNDYEVGLGLPCDDENPCTKNDVYINLDCDCKGDVVADCDIDVIGCPCDDGDVCTINDLLIKNSDSTVICEGTYIEGCTICRSGSACDDGNPCTINDVIFNCQCYGEDIQDDSKERPCDDGNECTIDDVYIDCKCVGTLIVNKEPCDDGDECTQGEIWHVNTADDKDCLCKVPDDKVPTVKIKTKGFNNPCEGVGGLLVAPKGAKSYSWRLDYKEVSSQQICEVFRSGTYTLLYETQNSGCYLYDSYKVVNSDIESIVIESTKKRVCAEPITLSIDESYPNVRWYSKTGTHLGDGNTLVISYPSTFKAVSIDNNGCKQFGTFVLNPAIDIDASLGFEPSKNFCKTGEFILDYKKTNANVDIIWTLNGNQLAKNNLNVLKGSKPGLYTVSIISNEIGEEGCLAYDEFKIPNFKDVKSIGEFLVLNGFKEYPVKFKSIPIKTKTKSYSIEGDCQYGTWTDKSGYEFINVQIDYGSTKETYDNLNKHVNEVICNNSNCFHLAGATLVSSFCNEDYFDFIDFMNFGEGLKYSIKMYIHYEEGSEDGIIYIWE